MDRRQRGGGFPPGWEHGLWYACTVMPSSHCQCRTSRLGYQHRSTGLGWTHCSFGEIEYTFIFGLVGYEATSTGHGIVCVISRHASRLPPPADHRECQSSGGGRNTVHTVPFYYIKQAAPPETLSMH